MSSIGVVATSAGGVETIRQGLVQPLVDEGHQVAITLTPTAAIWLDHLGEVRPPFSPETVAADFSEILKGYGIMRAVADRYAGAWVAEAFSRQGVTVEQCARPKSDLYGDLLPALNSGRVDLLDHPRLVAQLGSLERRTSRSGRDSIDHGPGGHDDCANAAAGALAAALARAGRKIDLADIIIGPPGEAAGLLLHNIDFRDAFRGRNRL